LWVERSTAAASDMNWPSTEASEAVARDLRSKRRRLPVVYIISVIGHYVRANLLDTGVPPPHYLCP